MENTLAEQVELRGTIRSFNAEVRQTLIREIDKICSLTRTLGGDYDLSIREGYPALVNDPALYVARDGRLRGVGAGPDGRRAEQHPRESGGSPHPPTSRGGATDSPSTPPPFRHRRVGTATRGGDPGTACDQLPGRAAAEAERPAKQ